MEAASVLFSSVQAFFASRNGSCFYSVLFCSDVLSHSKEKPLVFCSVLFRPSTQVEMQAAFVLFSSVQAFCDLGHTEAASVLFSSVQAF
jgi:hypothetical protein